MHQASASIMEPSAASAERSLELPPTACIVPSASGLFAFDEGTSERLAAIAEVLDPPGGVIDLVAWFPEDPGAWWLYHGNATLLGEEAVSRAQWLIEERAERAITLVETPAAWWWARDQRTACVLDWDAFDPIIELAGIDRVVCSNDDLAARLVERVRALMRPSFKVSVARRARSAA